MVNMTQIEAGVLAYIDEEILTKAAPLNKFAVGTAVALASPKFEKMLSELMRNPVISMLEVTDGDGFVDIDKVYAAAKEAYKRSGSITAFGIIFNEGDIDKLYEHIKKA